MVPRKRWYLQRWFGWEGWYMKQIIVTMRLVIFSLYLIVTPMLIILCYIKDKSELESLLKSFILVISIIGIILAIL